MLPAIITTETLMLLLFKCINRAITGSEAYRTIHLNFLFTLCFTLGNKTANSGITLSTLSFDHSASVFRFGLFSILDFNLLLTFHTASFRHCECVLVCLYLRYIFNLNKCYTPFAIILRFSIPTITPLTTMAIIKRNNAILISVHVHVL